VPSLIALKRRIQSVKNTRQITRAMQLVSASKMRRAQEYALRSRDYREAATELMQRLGAIDEVSKTPLFAKREVKNRLYVVITSNSGLAGAYNANILKKLGQALQQDRDDKIQSHVITIGNKGAQFVRRVENVALQAAYPAFGDQPTANDVRPLLNTIITQYEDGAVDDIRVLYTEFKSNLVQEATVLQLLPAEAVKTEGVPPIRALSRTTRPS